MSIKLNNWNMPYSAIAIKSHIGGNKKIGMEVLFVLVHHLL